MKSSQQWQVYSDALTARAEKARNAYETNKNGFGAMMDGSIFIALSECAIEAQRLARQLEQQGQ